MGAEADLRAEAAAGAAEESLREKRRRAVWSAATAKKGKSCDIGYALAGGSCEGVNSVDACTVTASDVTAAFAASNPNLLLAEPVGFFGLETPANCFTG